MGSENHTLLLLASILLWGECVTNILKALLHLAEEKAASMVLSLIGAAGYGYIAARLWGVA